LEPNSGWKQKLIRPKLASMNLVHLLPVGNIDMALLESLSRSLPECLPVRCEILASPLDPAAVSR
jgi:hypothetical protein